MAILTKTETPVGIKIVGDQAEAQSWLGKSSLSGSEIENLAKFITKFPQAKFYKFEKYLFGDYPNWLVNYQETLAGFQPGDLSWAQFEASDLNPTTWYNWQFTTNPTSEYEELYCDGQQLLFICIELETLHSMLVLKLGQELDNKIYQLDYENIESDDSGNGQIAAHNLTAIFTNFAELFARINALKPY